MDTRPTLYLLLLFCGLRAASPSTGFTAEPALDFNVHIRPILSNHCFQCHGPDDAVREADLRLDRRDSATLQRDGRAAIIPGDLKASQLSHRIQSQDPDERMPPPDFGKPLSKQQVELLNQWIAQGAPYARHWAFEPIRRATPPAVGDPAMVRNPIDQFVIAKLVNKGLNGSPRADRNTLIRRVYLDLLGLPPSPSAVKRFLNDQRPGAYERMVDRVLSSPRFGERWGRHWLDQARYADSHGYTNDNARSIWPYRDWVIAALNRDLPFDQFTIEQLAGDLLPSPTLAQQVATGFHRNTLINSEGGTKADQFHDEQVKDRVDTTGLVWMGLTVGCAKCHAHKYDPITQREYYELYAFFNSTADINSVTPTIQVPTDSQIERLENLESRQQELAAKLKNDPTRHQRQQAWEASLPKLAEAQQDSPDPDEEFPWTVVELSGKSLEGSKLISQDDQSLLVSGELKPKEEYHATTRSPLTKVKSVRLEVLTDDSLPQTGPGRAADGNFVLSEFWFRTGDGRELRFSAAFADHSQGDFEVTQSVDGKQDTGWAIGDAPEAGGSNHPRTAWFVLPEVLEVEKDHALTFKMQFHHTEPGHSLGRFRISISDQAWINRPTAAQLAPLANLPRERRSKDQQRKLDEAFLAQDPALSRVQKELDETTQAHDSLKRAIPNTMVLEELEKPRTTHMQIRGDFLRTADEVTPGVPGILPAIAGEGALSRLHFARWLVHPDHPLTARVRVNRIWMRLFGQGLVETENDFGVQGTLPTHPELLDWLASEMIRQGWSTKQFLRLVVRSATYQQSSKLEPTANAADPRNRLLSRQNRVRVEAEIVRDIALVASGQLGATMGGPSVYPPQPEGVYAFTQREKNWKNSEGEGRFRRGMYTFFYRSAPYPMLETFDVPKFNATCTQRNRSNTPLQSLTVANSEVMFELATKLAQRITREAQGDDARIEQAFALCFSRAPSESEAKIAKQYLAQARERFPDEATAWIALARVLMNLDEFITRE